MSSGGVNTTEQNSPLAKSNFRFQIRDGSDWIALRRRTIQTYNENRVVNYPQVFTTKDPWFSYGNGFRSETINGCKSCRINANTLQ